MGIDNLINNRPILEFESKEHPILKTEIQMPRLLWGETTFGFTTESDIIDIETWVHEFTEDVVGDLIAPEGVDVSTIAQIIGHAHGLPLIWEGHELFAPLHHLITSIATGTLVPTLDGFAYIEGNVVWDTIIEQGPVLEGSQ